MNTMQPIRDLRKIEQMKAVLRENGTRDLLLFCMGINTGIRISDLLKLTVADVRDKSHVEIHEQKTGKLKRFPIMGSLQSLIQEYTANKPTTEYLFKSRVGSNRPITRVMAFEIINNACRKCGIEDRISMHGLRKTFGYHHYKQFKDIVILQKIFNHSSSDITLRYIGIDQDKIDESYRNFIL